MFERAKYGHCETSSQIREQAVQPRTGRSQHIDGECRRKMRMSGLCKVEMSAFLRAGGPMAEERIALSAKERERLKVLPEITSGSYRFVGRLGIDKRIRNQDDPGELASKSLIEANLYLVVPIAEQHSPQGLSMLELIQEGNLGLRHAAKSFPGNDAIFVSYAASCVEDAITKAIAESRSAS